MSDAERIEKLTIENEKLKKENKKLKERNNELLHCVEVYQRFISGGQNNG